MLYNTNSFSCTTAQDTCYVSISRERHEVVVFTDDVEKLPERVDQMAYKGVAHELRPETVRPGVFASCLQSWTNSYR